jgi:DNA-binding GntR family transcriptional regulator
MAMPHASSSDRYTQSQDDDAWAADAASQHKTGTQRLLAVETGPPTPDVRDALRLPPDEDVVVRRRLILADEQPVEIAASYYPAHLAAGTPLAENKKIRGGAVRVLAESGHPLDESIERVTAVLPTDEEAAILEVGQHEPLIVIRRVSAPIGGSPVEYAVNRMVASRVEPLEYRLRNEQ